MLIELCCHTALAGRREAYLGALEGVGLGLAARHGAELLFLTVGDSGPLNEVVLAWSHRSMAAYAEQQASLDADPHWRDWSKSAALQLRRQVRQLVETTSFSTVALPPAGTRLIDLRCYSFKPGTLQDFLPLCELAGLPRQRRHGGALVFHGTSATGVGSQLVQAWAYASHEEYARGQSALMQDAQWARSYRERVIHLVDVQEHRYLKPRRSSPTAPPT